MSEEDHGVQTSINTIRLLKTKRAVWCYGELFIQELQFHFKTWRISLVAKNICGQMHKEMNTFRK